MVSDISSFHNALEQIAPTLKEQEKNLLLKLISILRSMRYGHIQITVHDSAIVQIDKTEKIRFEKPLCKAEGGDDRKE